MAILKHYAGKKLKKSQFPASTAKVGLDKEKDQMSPSGLDRARQDSNLQPSDPKSVTLSN
jgi:hypothetical protein